MIFDNLEMTNTNYVGRWLLHELGLFLQTRNYPAGFAWNALPFT